MASPQRRTIQLKVLLTRQEKRLLERHARAAGLTRSDWIRQVLRCGKTLAEMGVVGSAS